MEGKLGRIPQTQLGRIPQTRVGRAPPSGITSTRLGRILLYPAGPS